MVAIDKPMSDTILDPRFLPPADGHHADRWRSPLAGAGGAQLPLL